MGGTKKEREMWEGGVLLCCLEGTAAVQVSCFRGREKMERRIESWEGGEVKERKRG